MQLTVNDIRAMSKPTILASEAAQVLGCDPQWLRLMARERPERLGFPVCCVSAHRVKIPRLPFIKFLDGQSVYKLELTTLERLDLMIALVYEKARLYERAIWEEENAEKEKDDEIRKARGGMAEYYKQAEAACAALHERLKALTPV